MGNVRILLVEDDPDDVQLLQEALFDNGIQFEIDVLTDGERVLPYISKIRHQPDMIILDLNLPKVHGKEILVGIRELEGFANVPIVVFSTSASPHDVKFAYDHGANRFITKPSTIREFNTVIETIASMIGLRIDQK